MKQTQNKRTISDILHYIKLHSNEGKLKESMMKIAEGTGYSNATIHRSLKRLEQDGYIHVIPSKRHRTPHTIHYLGPEQTEVYDIVERANIAIRQLDEAYQEVRDVMDDMKNIVELCAPEEDYIDLH